jgi:hypothetical protein
MPVPAKYPVRVRERTPGRLATRTTTRLQAPFRAALPGVYPSAYWHASSEAIAS